MVDEFSIVLATVVFDGGSHLFDGLDRGKVGVEIMEMLHSPRGTHLRYAVTKW